MSKFYPTETLCSNNLFVVYYIVDIPYVLLQTTREEVIMSGLKFFFCFLALTCACSHTFSKTTTQTNPVFYELDPDMLQESTTLQILRGDYELNHYKLANYAKFMVVSHDRLNFRVELTHKWRDLVNPCDWHAYLKIDNRQYPLQCEKRSVRQITWMWDEERRQVLRVDQFGDPVVIEGYERSRTTLDSMVIFVGKANFTVYSQNIISKKTKRVELVLEKDKTKFVFTWNLEPPDPDDEE